MSRKIKIIRKRFVILDREGKNFFEKEIKGKRQLLTKREKELDYGLR